MSTTVTKRPDTPIRTNGSTITGAGALDEVLADDADGTYATTNSPFTFNRVRFASHTIPTGGLLTKVVLRVRARTDPSATKLIAGLNQRTGLLFTPGSGVFATSSSAPQPAFTVADIAFGVSLEWTSSGPENVDLSEAYLDVTYVAVPVVSVTAPTGTIAVTRPTVEWETSGDFAQERFQVKIYASAQYGGVGFDEDTSTPFYDSGPQLGPDEEFVPTVNLPNDDDYRFYVRVAQRVGSVVQWSAWDFETVTVDVTPPIVPTLTVEAEDGLGRIKVTVDGTGTPAWEFVTVERSTDGTTWTAVRSADRRAVSGTEFSVYDYETGNGQLVQYRAQAIIADTGGDVASDWSATSGAVAWTSGDTWLKSLTNPPLNTKVRINGIPTLKRRIPRGVLDVAGRPDPIVRSDTRKWPEGTVTFVTLTDAELAAIQALLDTSETLLLQTLPGEGFGSRYISCGDEDEIRTGGRASEPSRYVEVPFHEVAAPVGDVITFGITWADVIAAYADWDEVLAAYQSWGQLVSAEL